MPKKTAEQLAVLRRLYNQRPNPMTGWGRAYSAALQEAKARTGLSDTQIKVSYTTIASSCINIFYSDGEKIILFLERPKD